MKKLILFLTVLSLQYSTFGQNSTNDDMYIMIDEEKYGNLYLFDKEKNRATMKIIDFDKRHKGFDAESKPVSVDDIVIVRPQPYSIYTEFVAAGPPKILHTIDGLTTFTIEDVSKGDKNVFRKYRHTMNFIQKQEGGGFLVWEMDVILQE